MTTRIRHQAAPNPDGCRWCGEARHHHGRSYVASQGVHSWEQPTNAQRLARMRARRERRLTAKPAYHAATRWVATSNPEEGIPLCADCRTEGCVRWLRAERRRLQRMWRSARYTASKADVWGGEPW